MEPLIQKLLWQQVLPNKEFNTYLSCHYHQLFSGRDNYNKNPLQRGDQVRIRRLDDFACLIFHRDGRLFNGLEMFSLGQKDSKRAFNR